MFGVVREREVVIVSDPFHIFTEQTKNMRDNFIKLIAMHLDREIKKEKRTVSVNVDLEYNFAINKYVNSVRIKNFSLDDFLKVKFEEKLKESLAKSVNDLSCMYIDYANKYFDSEIFAEGFIVSMYVYNIKDRFVIERFISAETLLRTEIRNAYNKYVKQFKNSTYENEVALVILVEKDFVISNKQKYSYHRVHSFYTENIEKRDLF